MTPGLLSTLKTNNKVLNVLGSVYAKENQYDNCLLLNTHKSIVEALNGNLFLVKGNVIKTPPLEDGCLKGIMRKQVLEIIKKIPCSNAIMRLDIMPIRILVIMIIHSVSKGGFGFIF